MELVEVTRIELVDGTIKRELVFLGAVQLGKLRRDVENLKIEVLPEDLKPIITDFTCTVRI